MMRAVLATFVSALVTMGINLEVSALRSDSSRIKTARYEERTCDAMGFRWRGNDTRCRGMRFAEPALALVDRARRMPLEGISVMTG
ncbi:hypothetical protein P152DRAFT_180889 [Eremomyces bilateralis CBS 781.70]|uniref:Uncharacterized protein n=1 Tax=Eremomyces bilateralis CBS 781.70 TaxID=1392243 RepID=A0A6G1GB10_9PEZI|nr:uncharacterized protein P152DRAFT_180889 [Eremomyces bilateralis CBS 781.70]KAF1815287.1 hypothetical protein P152DRAFT_180889 [Eremomyces bilateralis CBS 781.70]